jgi:hypothetical protein
VAQRGAGGPPGTGRARAGVVPATALAIALLAAALLGLSGFMAWEVPRISRVTAAHTDFIETLYGLRAFAAGRDPYGDAVAAQVDRAMAGHAVPAPRNGHYEHPFDYLLPPALIYLPATPLPDEAAIVVVRAATVALYLAALLLLIWRFAAALPAGARVGLLLLGIAWWPFLSVILPIVQQAGTIFALLALAALAAERGRWSWAGAAAFLALLKPTESAPFVLLLALWALRSRASRRPFATGLLAVGAPACLLALAVRPTWIADWLRTVAALRAGHFGYFVDLPGGVAAALGLPGALGAVAALAVGAVWAVLTWRAAGAAASEGDPGAERLWWWAGLTCVLTLLLVPRTGTYDMVIGLIPWFVALRAAGSLAPTRRRLAYAALVALLVGAGFVAYADHAGLELPALALGLLAALWLARPRAGWSRAEAVGQAAMPAVRARSG